MPISIHNWKWNQSVNIPTIYREKICQKYLEIADLIDFNHDIVCCPTFLQTQWAYYTTKIMSKMVGLNKGLQRELSHVNVTFFLFQGYSDIRESPLLWKKGDFHAWYWQATFRHNCSLQGYGTPFQCRLPIFIGKNL